MGLREEFETTGNWLFKWRSYLPLLMVGVFLFSLRDYEYLGPTLDGLWEIFCIFVSFFGLAIRVFTIGYAPKGTSGRNTKTQIADTLNTTGLYSVVRHPLYLGNFFMGLGVSLFHHLWWLAFIYILVFWLYYERIMFAEEAYLRNKFGDNFLMWSNWTPAFIPAFKNWVSPSLPFSTRNALKREYNGFFAVIVALFALELASDIVTKGKPELDLMWAIILSFSFVVWIVLRTLKKKTNILNVEGR
jgi:protein-S-isoprenylcysteine O-methyltransferase Ste14